MINKKLFVFVPLPALLYADLLLAQSTEITGFSSYLNYGLAGVMLFLMILMFKYFTTQISKDNSSRDDRYKDVVDDLKLVINKVDSNFTQTSQRFVDVLNKQMDQNSYTVSVLTELRDEIRHHNASAGRRYDDLERKISEKLDKLVLHYNIMKKEG